MVIFPAIATTLRVARLNVQSSYALIVNHKNHPQIPQIQKEPVGGAVGYVLAYVLGSFSVRSLMIILLPFPFGVICVICG